VFDFVTKDDAHKILTGQPPGTFLIRYNPSLLNYPEKDRIYLALSGVLDNGVLEDYMVSTKEDDYLCAWYERFKKDQALQITAFEIPKPKSTFTFGIDGYKILNTDKETLPVSQLSQITYPLAVDSIILNLMPLSRKVKSCATDLIILKHDIHQHLKAFNLDIDPENIFVYDKDGVELVGIIDGASYVDWKRESPLKKVRLE